MSKSCGSGAKLFAVTVLKFGGSSLASLALIEQVAGFLVRRQQQGEPLVVVVSAMGDTTEVLLRQAFYLSPNPPQREIDMLITAGERMSMALLSMAIVAQGGRALSLTGSQSGIITSTEHGSAQVVALRPYRIAQALSTGHIVVVAGFQGVSQQAEITTLGRGGSDLTAVALATWFGQRRCTLYSDVAGMFTADPALVADARLCPLLHYHQALAMAHAGANVLHAAAVAYAAAHGVTIYARKSLALDETKFTMVSPWFTPPQLAVVSNRDVLWLPISDHTLRRCQTAMMQAMVQRGGRLVAANQHGYLLDTRGMFTALDRLQQWLLQVGIVSQPMASVTVVGASVATQATWYRRLVAYPHGFVLHTASGPCLVLPRSELATCVQHMHQLAIA